MQTSKAHILFSIYLVIFLSAETIRSDICRESPCVYNFVVRSAMSMTYRTSSDKLYNVKMRAEKLEIVENSFRPATEFPNNLDVGTEVNPDDVITLDGNPRTILVINDQYPGPTIEVMEGLEVSNMLK